MLESAWRLVDMVGSMAKDRAVTVDPRTSESQVTELKFLKDLALF